MAMEIYTPVSNRNTGKIKSPMDLIIKKSFIEKGVEENDD